MKIIILCGGYGTRLSEETKVKPKPMVKIGNIPIIEHIIHIYKKYGFDNFILALGYKGYYIKKAFQKKKINNIKLINTGLKNFNRRKVIKT